MLARELAALNEQYRNLVDAVSAGSMSIDQAMLTLDNLSATDSDGNVWRLDLEGRFLSGRPGEQPQLSDPMRFALQTPGPWDAPPVIPATHSIPTFPYSGANDGHHAVSQPNTGKVSRSKKSNRSKSDGPRTSWMTSALKRVAGSGRLRTPLIVIGAIIAAAMIWGNTNTQEPNGTALPVESLQDGQSSDVAVPPARDGMQSQIDVVLAQLGDPAIDPLQIITDAGTGKTLLLRRAQFAGYRSVGLELVSTKLSETANGLQVELELRDDAGQVVVNGSVEVTVDGETLKLQSWPEMGRKP